MNKEILEMAFSHYGPKEMAEFLTACKETETAAPVKEVAEFIKPVAVSSGDMVLLKGPEAARYLSISEDGIRKLERYGELKNENPIPRDEPGGHLSKFSKQQLDWVLKNAPEYYLQARRNYQDGIDAEPDGYLSAEHVCVVFGISASDLDRIEADNKGRIDTVRGSKKGARGGHPRKFYRREDLCRVIYHTSNTD